MSIVGFSATLDRAIDILYYAWSFCPVDRSRSRSPRRRYDIGSPVCFTQLLQHCIAAHEFLCVSQTPLQCQVGYFVFSFSFSLASVW